MGVVTPVAVRPPSATSSDEVMRVSGSARLLASVAHDCRVAGCAAVSWGKPASEPPHPASSATAMAESARVGWWRPVVGCAA